MRLAGELKRFRQIPLHWPTRSQIVKLGLALTPFAIGAVTIFWGFQSVGLSHWDEYYFTGAAAAMSPSTGWGGVFPYDPPLFPLILFIMFKSFGFHDYVATTTSGIMAILLCVAVFVWVNNQYGLNTAAMSTSILASTELFIFYAKMALSDMAFTLFFSLAVFAYFHALRSQKGWAYISAGITLTLALAVKYNGFQPFLVAAIFVPILHLVMVGKRKGALKDKVLLFVRAILRSLSGLWLSIAPAILFTIVFLAFLGRPFRPSDSTAMSEMFRNLIPRVSEGVSYFVQVVYPTKDSVFSIHPFVTANFFSNVLTQFVAAPVLLLGLIGAVKGMSKRNLPDVLMIIWVSFVFVYFASTRATYPRVILPMVVPIAILAGSGLSWVISALDHFPRIHMMRALRTRKYRTMAKVTLTLVVICVNMYLAVPAVTDTHSAYRTAAEFIAKNVPDGQLVWFKTQAVLLAYLGLLGKHVRVSDNITQIDQAYVIALDFVAESYPEWPQIQARISTMQLVFDIRNDVPVVNVLDWTDFPHLENITSSRARMSIRIYSRVGVFSSSVLEPTSGSEQDDGFWLPIRAHHGTLSSLNFNALTTSFATARNQTTSNDSVLSGGLFLKSDENASNVPCRQFSPVAERFE